MMKKILLLAVILTAGFTAGGHGFYWNAGIEEIPMFIIGMDKDALGFYSFFNILNGNVSLNLNDNLGLKFRLKYTYFAMTNVGASNQHKLYPDRLSVYYNSDAFSVLAGRDNYVENNGLLIGNLADGLKLQFNLLGFREKLYVYYSGLLPKDINQFSADVYDATNAAGANRLSAGLVIEKFGWFFKSLSLTALYSMNMVTNYVFNPFYIGLAADGAILAGLTYNAAAALEFGSMTGSVGVFGWAGSAGVIYAFENPIKFGFIADLSLASGDSTNTTNTYEGFNSFGKFSTGYVLAPDFSNLLIFKLGGFVKLLDGHLDLKLNYLYITRLDPADSLNGYYTGTNAQVGHEFNTSANYEIDPNFSLFLNAGYLLGNQSLTNKPSVYKIVAGASLKI